MLASKIYTKNNNIFSILHLISSERPSQALSNELIELSFGKKYQKSKYFYQKSKYFGKKYQKSKYFYQKSKYFANFF